MNDRIGRALIALVALAVPLLAQAAVAGPAPPNGIPEPGVLELLGLGVAVAIAVAVKKRRR